jgi:hypothetical protein
LSPRVERPQRSRGAQPVEASGHRDTGVIDPDMLRSCWADEAGQYRSPAAWADTAVPFLLALDPRDNGRPLTAP